MAAVVSLCSAKGSPGATVLSLALAYAWPRPVLLVEADVSSGSAILAGHLNGREQHERGLLGLGLAHRRNGRITERDLWQQTLQLAEGRYLLPGLSDPVQAAQMTATWPIVADALGELNDVDVIVDYGRLGTAFDAAPVLNRSDLVITVSRCSLADAYALTRRLPALTAVLPQHALRLATVGDRDPYPPGELSRKLGVPLICEVPWDPFSARVYSHGHQGQRRRTRASLDARAGEAAAKILAAARRPLSAGPEARS